MLHGWLSSITHKAPNLNTQARPVRVFLFGKHMTTEPEKRPPFKIHASGTIEHINVRKQGPDDDKFLALDVKLSAKAVSREICGYFEPALTDFLWFQGSEDKLIVRNMFLEPLRFFNVVEGASAVIGGMSFLGVDAKKFNIQPRDGGVVDMVFSLTILHPTADDVSRLARLLQEDIGIKVDGAPDIFE